MTSKVSLLARVVCQPGKETEFEQTIRDAVLASGEESSLEIYSAHRSSDAPGEYYFFEVYTEPSARGVHGGGPEMAAALPALRELLAAAPEVTLMSPVAAKGITL